MKKFVINRVDLGQRVTGYEVFHAETNGGEILGYTPRQMMDAIKGGDVLGLVVDDTGAMVADKAKGFYAIMVKTGVGTLTNPDPCAMTNVIYTVYGKRDADYKVISSRFGRQTFCADKIKALLELSAVNGVLLDGEQLVGAWDVGAGQENPTTEGKKKGA